MIKAETTTPGSLEMALQNVGQAARRLVSTDVCAVLAVHPFTKQFLGEPFISGELGRHEEVTKRKLYDLAPEALEKGILNLSLKDDPGDDNNPIKTLTAITLYTKQKREPLAVLFVGCSNPSPFDLDKENQLKLFAEESALLLESSWLVSRYREVTRIGQVLNLNLSSVENLFDQLRAGVASVLDINYFFMLAVYHPQADTLDFHLTLNGVTSHLRDSPLRGACAWVINENRPLVVNHLGEDTSLPVRREEIPGTAQQDPESLIFVPLSFRGMPLGVMSIQHPSPNIYDGNDLQIMELLGNQVALALNNLQLFDYLQSLNDTAQQLTRQLNAEQLLQDVVDRIREVTEADIVILYPYFQNTKRFEHPHVSGLLLEPEHSLSGSVNPDNIITRILTVGEPIWARDSSSLYAIADGDYRGRKGDFERREGIRATAAVPLQVGDERVGVLFINFRHPQRFEAALRHLISGLANYAAIAIKNSREFSALTRRRVEELEALQRIEREISKSLKLDQVLHEILVQATGRVPADNASILLYNPRTKVLETKAFIGIHGSQVGMTIPVPEGRGIQRWVYEHKVPARVDNVREESRWREVYIEVVSDTVSEMDVPLIDQGEVIGAISFQSSKAAAFNQADEDFIVTLAGQAVLAIRNAQAYENEQRIIAVLRAMQEVGEAVVSSLKLQEVLETILEKALEITGSTTGQVFLFDPQREDVYCAAERGPTLGLIDKRMPRAKGIVGWVFEHKTLLNVNVNETPWSQLYERLNPEIRWELAVPILEASEVRGVINIESTADYPFTDQSEAMLTKLADLATIALQNADQYERAESGKRRLEALHEVDKAIIRHQGNLEQVMRLILSNARLLIGAEIGYLHLYESGQPGRIYLNKWSLSEAREIFRHVDASENFPVGIARLVASRQSPYIVRGDAQDDPYFMGNPDIHSEIAVPLVSGSGDLIGVLNLQSPRHFAFDNDDLEVLELFAREAVIAIQNARNYRQATEESQRFQLLWQAAHELSGVIDLQHLEDAYDIVIKHITNYYDCKVVIRRYDESARELVTVQAGNEPDTPSMPRIKLLDEGVDGRAARERRTIVASEMRRLLACAADPGGESSANTLVVVPLQSRQRYYGNLVVSHDTAHYFKEADVRLLEGLAQQLAVTIHRIETVQARREAEQQARELEMLGEFGQSAYEITHRLGNDLGLVRTYINLIRRELKTLPVEKPAISENLDNILRDVSSVLNMSRKLKEKIYDLGVSNESNRANVSVKELLEELKLTFSVPESIHVTWAVEDDSMHVNVVTGQIIDLLRNLVINAIEAMPDGGAIEIRAFYSSPYINIRVADTGPGIPRSARAKIFNLFYSTKTSSGFGLWSARRYAQANGGDLVLEDQTPRGAAFTLLLPVAEE
jgi:GAF domain-containing protein